jgi:hypothetical protein
MKKSLIILIVAGLSFLSLSCIHLGNKNITTFERTFSSFNKIHNSGSAVIRYHAAQDFRAVVSIDSNLEKYVELKIRGDTLNIGTKSNRAVSYTKFEVDVYCPVLTGVSLTGSGKFTAIDKIIAPSFDVNLTGSGNVEGTAECNNYSVKISGSGKLNKNIVCNDFKGNISGSGNAIVAGSSKDFDITLTGSGDFKGLEFKTNNANARITGSGDLDIWAENNLTARVTGSGNIRYRGNPKINFSGSGSGRIRSASLNE